MALSRESLARAARRKALMAREKVRTAEEDLDAANDALRQAIPRKDLKAITAAAERTLHAEEEVRDAAHELDGVEELLRDETPPRPHGSASGEGVRSLLPYLQRRRR